MWSVIIYLSSTSNHIFNVMLMSWAVNVGIMSVFSLVLNVCSSDGDTTSYLTNSLFSVLHIIEKKKLHTLLLRRFINIRVFSVLSQVLLCKNFGDSCSC